MNEDKLFLRSKCYKYFNNEMQKDKIVRDTLLAFEEILSIKRNIKNIYNTDDPDMIKKLIGKNINGIIVSQKDFDYALLIKNTYDDLYIKCKKLLNGEK